MTILRASSEIRPLALYPVIEAREIKKGIAINLSVNSGNNSPITKWHCLTVHLGSADDHDAICAIDKRLLLGQLDRVTDGSSG